MAAGKSSGRPSGGGSSSGGGFSGGGSKGSRPSSGSSRPSSSGGASNYSNSRPSPSAAPRPSAPVQRPYNPAPPRPNSYRAPQQPYHTPHDVNRARRRGAAGGFIGGMMVGGMMNNRNNNSGGDTYNYNYYNDPQGGAYNQNQPYAQQNVPQQGICGYCGGTYRAGDSKCPSCGASVPPLQSAPAGGAYAPPQSQPGYQPYDASYQQQAPIKAKKKKNRKTIIAVVIIAAVVLIGIVILSNLNKPKTYTFTTNETQSTEWFDFTVTHTETVYTYNGGSSVYNAPEGNMAIIIDITLKNTFDEDIDMVESDFLVFGDDFATVKDYYPVLDTGFYGCFDTSAIQMFRFLYDAEYDVNYFTLKSGQTLKGRLVFEIPDDVETATLDYTEFYEGGKQGNSYQMKLF